MTKRYRKAKSNLKKAMTYFDTIKKLFRAANIKREKHYRDRIKTLELNLDKQKRIAVEWAGAYHREREFQKHRFERKEQEINALRVDLQRLFTEYKKLQNEKHKGCNNCG